MSLEINESENTLVAATVGKSIMSFPLDQIFKKIVSVHNQNALYDLRVYPNPATNEIKLLGLSDNYKPTEISILNNLGKEIKNFRILNESNPNIQIDMLPDGIYFLLVKSDKILKTLTFIKQYSF